MANKRIPPEVQSAIDNAKTADWDVSIRNQKIVISAPDGVAITMGFSPNDESMKKFRRDAAKYNLIEGPARTPQEQEAVLAQLEAESEKQAAKDNAQRKAFEAEQERKRAAAAEAAKKIAEATKNGMAPEPESEAPVAREIPEGIPPFNKDLLGQTKSELFLFLNAAGLQEYYCVECWEHGKRFTSKRPQGLAAHRGVRHGAYSEGADLTSHSPETPLVNNLLPSDVNDALDLLVSVIGDNLAGATTPAEVEGLKAKVRELEDQLAGVQRDLELSDKQYTDAKAAFDQASQASKKKIHELTKDLNGKDGLHQTEVQQLTESFRILLTKVQEALNTQAPIQAIGSIDSMIKPYLG